jgi:phenylacetate-CoA ligase
VEDGNSGNICDTVLFKDTVYPVIRFDTKDVSTILPGDGALGLPLKRLSGFQGRSDNMVKLRGINVYPTGISLILKDIKELTSEYVCRVEKIGDADVMTVICESHDVEKKLELLDRIRLILRQRLGVRLEVEITHAGGTAELTQINARQKPIRLIDLRK